MTDSVYLKENFTTHLLSIMPTGYTLVDEYCFLKELNDRDIRIFIGNTTYYPHSVEFGTVSLYVRFHSVEQVFHNIYANNPLSEFHHDSESSTFSIDTRNSIGQSGIDFLRNNEVEDDKTFAQVKPYLEQMINNALNFLDNHPTLQDYYNYGESLSVDDNAIFYEQPLHPRYAIVMHFLNIPYSSFLTTCISEFNQYGMTEDANFCQAIKDYLDNM
jgi:hypothetical protein